MLMRVLHLFAGAGGSHLAGEMLGWESVGSVEIEPYCQAVLRLHYPNEAIHGDICTFSATHLNGLVDGVVGGFPCQDISSAGKGAGITGERSGLWKEFARIIGECRPRWALIENSPLLRTRGLEVVLGDLASLGYDAEWATYRASDVGAPHRRDRMWVLAYVAHSEEIAGRTGCDSFPPIWGERDNQSGWSGAEADVPDPTQIRWHQDAKRFLEQICQPADPLVVPVQSEQACEWVHQWDQDPADDVESQVGRVVNGLADPLLRWNRVHALAALGNGWVPQQAAEAFRQLWRRAFGVAYSADYNPAVRA